MKLTLFFVLLVMTLSGCNQQESEKKSLQYSDSAAASSKPVYHFAVHPLHNPQKLSASYQPFIDYLNQQIPNIHIELESSRDYQAFEEKYRQRLPEMLLPNPWQTIQAIENGYQVVAMAGDADDFKGIVLVPKDSPIKTPRDLKGKIVSYPSHTALAACMMPQFFFHQNGINVSTDITNSYVGSQESAIMNVYLGKSSAGVTWPPPWRAFQKDHPKEAEKLKVIWQTPSLVNNSVMLRDNLPPETQKAIKEAIYSLSSAPDSHKILSAMETSNFYPADNGHYQVVTDYIEQFEREVRPVSQK